MADSAAPLTALSGHDEFDENISELATPAAGPYKFKKKRGKWPKGTHDQVTRQFLAFAVLGILTVLYFMVMFALVCGWIDGEKFTMAVAAISGPQALAAAVIGFYYGKNGSNDS
ncbi:hypothetical protein C3B59_09735 [Cryobacterium zongtaii]|uniref:Uncharacterized protein n=1 Tax=Cryobacterium zongtaii TaxID=1259217 RepID=A0A2S3ZDX9_9MICO|nr:hypothetical protein [Cryobacterium zongtaii]POH64708.1 hypothetical protein C3B59_09735 [Cryobacterium zongtaii]